MKIREKKSKDFIPVRDVSGYKEGHVTLLSLWINIDWSFSRPLMYTNHIFSFVFT